jgi:competence ComEA-like helix-hairpin-helix protein
MTDGETRVLARTAAVLLVASMARYAWEARRGGPAVLPDAADDGPALLAESRRLVDENEARARPLGPGERVDPNRASAVELDRLPGVGPAAARAIVAAREREGGFASMDDLLRVQGIGDGTLARMRPHLELRDAPPRVVGRRGTSGGGAAVAPPAGARPPTPRAPDPRPPLDLNRASAAELERLAGVGPALAARILQERARSGSFTAVDDLLRVRGIGPATLERLRPRVRVGGR